MENNNVIVTPVVRRKPWINTDKFNKNKLLGAKTILQPYFGPEGFKTGLENNEALQKEFENELNLPEGTLKPSMDNDYWHEEMNIVLEDNPNTFNRNIPKDRLKLLILKNHPLVAPSEAEITPDSEFYIVDIYQEQERKATKAEQKAKAYALLTSMSPQEQRQFCKLYGTGGMDMSEKDVFVELGIRIEDNVVEFLSKAEFSKEVINIRAFIFDLVEYNILRIRGGNYFDSDEDKGDLKTLSNYLLAPDKQSVYLNLKERLEYAKKGK